MKLCCWYLSQATVATVVVQQLKMLQEFTLITKTFADCMQRIIVKNNALLLSTALICGLCKLSSPWSYSKYKCWWTPCMLYYPQVAVGRDYVLKSSLKPCQRLQLWWQMQLSILLNNYMVRACMISIWASRTFMNVKCIAKGRIALGMILQAQNIPSFNLSEVEVSDSATRLKIKV